MLAEWTGDAVDRVAKIAFEWKPVGKDHCLADRTSFDVYVTYVRPGTSPTLGAVGVEVKYTERAYSWTKLEKARMFDADSAYHRVHRASKIYRGDAPGKLATRRLKQLWRNQLLGEGMLQRGAMSRFTSVLLYPSGNKYFGEVVGRYGALLDPAHNGRFVGVTYEHFIASARQLCKTAEAAAWLDYLARRYVMTDEA